ncbi:MAG TPA: sugar phosphate isomerase/epimerase family protein [Pirellulales bacterium]|jgi:D-psicose/D-tagatose/L-ribulose 3-epimerase|nr:sugar phosphate isomerase/epimerase family protein [Pirellulales bacterium]
MPFGINLLLWTDRLHEGLLPVLEMLKQQGWDGVEVPIHDLSVDYRAWARHLDNLDLRRTASTVRTAADNPISADPKIRAAGVDATRRTLDCCQALEAEILMGPFHSALGEFTGCGRTEDEWRWGVESMRQVAQHADEVGVTLALEFLNRFECYFLNHTADMIQFVQAVNHPRCRMVFDTFHAHVEEKNSAAALRASAPYLEMVHVSENDRGTPGQGQIAWPEVFDALREMDFDGWLVVEAFGMALPAVQAATKIWRRMFESEEQLAHDALAHLKVGMRI